MSHALALLVLLIPAAALAAPTLSEGVQQVGVDPRLGDRVPLDLRFRDAQGRAVRLGDAIVAERPVLLVMAYARCTTLCGTVLRGLGEALPGVALVPGRDYTPLVVSLDPRETVDEAARRQALLLEQVGRPGEPARWPYLVGDRAAIDALAAAIGLRTFTDPASGQIAHPGVLTLLTADGRVAGYLDGLAPDPARIDEALRGAAAGRAVVAQLGGVLRCFRFDPAARRHGEALQTTYRVGGAVLLTLLLGLITGLSLVERRRPRRPS